MFWFLKNHTYPIGVDMGDDSVNIVQLIRRGKNISLIAADSEDRPAEVKLASANWQNWAIETIKKIIQRNEFRGKQVVAAIPASQIFIDHIKVSRTEAGDNIEQGSRTASAQSLFSKIKQKLPFDPAEAIIRYIPAGEDNVLVVATERTIIDRHLAVYEKANLQIKSIGVWPIALTNTYIKFFGRRKTDTEAIVMLVDIQANRTNVVICRHKNLLFARSISKGTQQLDTNQGTPFRNQWRNGNPQALTRLVLELSTCQQHFSQIHRKAQIQRLIFLSGAAVDTELYTTIAKQLQLPAQMGNCLAAVQLSNPHRVGIDRRVSVSTEQTTMQMQRQINWATAFGLSLSQEEFCPWRSIIKCRDPARGEPSPGLVARGSSLIARATCLQGVKDA